MLLKELRERWWRRVRERGLEGERLRVKARVLRPEEAIGKPSRNDYPLLKGKEVMIEACVRDGVGQAFTDQPSNYSGTLESLYNLPLNSNRNRALLVAGINATYSLLGLVKGVKHCRDEGPELCAERMARVLLDEVGGDVRLGMIGLQPAIADRLSKVFRFFRVTDRDSENIGRRIGEVIVESSESNPSVIEWSDVLLITGTTLVNGTIDYFLKFSENKKLYFYGVTIASAAYEFGLRRLCFAST